jgi:AraC-like DNA-binding protein
LQLQIAGVFLLEIAAQLGFTDSGYFHRYFKSRTDYTPMQYRLSKEHYP